MLITNLITEKMPGSIHTESAINFYKSINAPLRAISILEDGFKLPFRNKEIPQFWIRNNKSFFTYYDFAKEKLQEWVSSGYAIETSERPRHISALSVAQRVLVTDEVKLRLCFDGTTLNDLMIDETTKLPSLEYSEKLIEKGDYFVTLDLQNCYFHVKIHASDHDKIAFAFPVTGRENETEFRYFYVKILIYGLKPATLVIHTLTKPLIDHLASKKIKSTIFIDDIRINSKSADAAIKDTLVVKDVFSKAGWIFNDGKETSPSQEVYYLGFFDDSVKQKYRVHENKIRQVKRRISELEKKTVATPKELAVIVGKIISWELATSYIPRLRCFKYFTWIPKVIKSDADWHSNKNFPKALIPTFKQAIEDVKRLSGTIRRKKHVYEEIKSRRRAKTQNVFAGDGNELYGAYYNVTQPYKYSIIKFDTDEEMSSSKRELLVLHHCVKENVLHYKGRDIVYFTDSQVLYFWHLYGTANSRVADILRETKELCVKNDILLEVSWKPREDIRIQLADVSCRTSTDEFSLPHKIYKQVCTHFNFYPKVDLFASTILHKTDYFYSKMPTLGSSGANALNFPWNERSYCHPPTVLIQDVFKKIEAERILDMTLIFLKTAHDTDLRKLLDEEGRFKNYVRAVIQFDSKVHFPGENPSRFMISYHTWYAMRIIKPCDQTQLTSVDILPLR